jgi:lipopolysaccharide/colanic/teichoic acid biosynthesis glycosyltransferase
VEDALEKLQYDLYYIKNLSLFLDLVILVSTVQVVLFGRGAR